MSEDAVSPASTPPNANSDPEAEWLAVYSGSGPQLSFVESELVALGLPVLRVPPEDVGNPEVGVFGSRELAIYELRVPQAELASRGQEVAALLASLKADTAESLSAQAEAEQDYDVRACPTCRVFFHDFFAMCPNDGATLVPAVECLPAGVSEPQSVVLAVGEEAELQAPEARLRAAGLTPAVTRPQGWSQAALTLPWTELVAETVAAEAAVRGESA